MESKEILGMMSAYSSIYEKKEEPEMEEGEKEESEKDEGGKHKEGKHKKGKEEKGEKVTEKEDEEDEKEMKEEIELDEDSAALSAAARRRAQEMGAKRRRTPAYKAGGNRGTGRNERAAYDLSNKQRSAAANPDTQTTRSKKPSTMDTGMHSGDYDRYNRKDPKKNPKHEANNETSTESYDLFDHILEHLVAEGYADTNKAALAIMANMSEEWKQSILDEEAPKIIGLQPASPRMVKGYPLGSSKVHDPSKMKDKKVVRK